MADQGQFAQDADILDRVGNGAHSDVTTAGFFDEIIVSCEAIINARTRNDWTALDTASTLDASIRGLLIDCGACLAAIYGITYDMSGFNSRVEAEDRINVLRDRYLMLLSILSDKKTQTFMEGL